MDLQKILCGCVQKPSSFTHMTSDGQIAVVDWHEILNSSLIASHNAFYCVEKIFSLTVVCKSIQKISIPHGAVVVGHRHNKQVQKKPLYAFCASIL